MAGFMSLLMSWRACAIWSADRAGGRPKRTPFHLSSMISNAGHQSQRQTARNGPYRKTFRKGDCRFAGSTFRELEGWKASVIAMNGMAFDLLSPHGRMLATLLSGIAEFERDLISARVKSGLAAAKARGKKLGRQTGERPKSDRLTPKVMALIADRALKPISIDKRSLSLVKIA